MPTVRSLVEGLRQFALSLPEAWEDHPWGESAIKVRKRIFVFLGKSPAMAERVGFAVKLPDSGVELLDEPYAEPTGYGLGRSGWVSVGFERGEEASLEKMCAWIEESYRAVAPKTLLKKLEGGGAAQAPASAKKKAGKKGGAKKATKKAAKKKVVKRKATKKKATRKKA